MKNYKSQFDQDKFLDQVIFNKKKNGFFVDIGAYDGFELSNSFFFERNRAWKGICIEPNPSVFVKLKKIRLCKVFNVGIGTKRDELLFRQVDEPLAVLSGFVDFFDFRHVERIEKEISSIKGSYQNIMIPIEKFSSIVNQREIDFISLDTEGNELEILKSIDFSYFRCKAITIENNFNENDISDYLSMFGYIKIFRLGCDDIFLLKGEFNFGVKLRLLPWWLKRRIKLHKKGLIKRLGINP